MSLSMKSFKAQEFSYYDGINHLRNNPQSNSKVYLLKDKTDVEEFKTRANPADHEGNHFNYYDDLIIQGDKGEMIGIQADAIRLENSDTAMPAMGDTVHFKSGPASSIFGHEKFSIQSTSGKVVFADQAKALHNYKKEYAQDNWSMVKTAGKWVAPLAAATAIGAGVGLARGAGAAAGAIAGAKFGAAGYAVVGLLYGAKNVIEGAVAFTGGIHRTGDKYGWWKK